MSMNYDYDEQAAGHADDVTNRVDATGAYVGSFKNAWAIRTAKEGHGIHFEFEVQGAGSVGLDLYTMDKDGKKFFGYNQLQAMQTVLGVKGLKTAPGKITVYSQEENKRVEADGDVFPDLIGKRIGMVLQKELYTKNSGADGYRMNIYAIFHPESRLMASEIRENKVKPEKLEKAMKVKDKDSRTSKQEPAQPSVGISGNY